MRVLVKEGNSAKTMFKPENLKNCKKVYVLSDRSIEMVENSKHEWRYRTVASYMPDKLYNAIKADPYLSKFLMTNAVAKEWPSMLYPHAFCYATPNAKGSLAVTPIYWRSDGKPLPVKDMKKIFMEFFGIPSKRYCTYLHNPDIEMRERSFDNYQQIYVGSHELCDMVDGVATIYPVVVSSLTFATLSAKNAILDEYEALQFLTFKYAGIPAAATNLSRPTTLTVSKSAKNEATLYPEDFMALYHPYFKEDYAWSSYDFVFKRIADSGAKKEDTQYNEKIEYVLRDAPKDMVGWRLMSMCPDEVKAFLEDLKTSPSEKKKQREALKKVEDPEPTYEQFDPFEGAHSLEEAEHLAAIRRGEIPPDEEDDDDVDTKVLDGQEFSGIVARTEQEIDAIVREKMGMSFAELTAQCAKSAVQKELTAAISPDDAIPTDRTGEHDVDIIPNVSGVVNRLYCDVDEAQQIAASGAAYGVIGEEPEGDPDLKVDYLAHAEAIEDAIAKAAET